ncbi:MAG: hypothetical protein IPP59_13440 [Betaproteobacteria bacterium]|nr:hypothetical protein [Candidatus Dechloromonas phosphorivorans]
MEIELKSAEFFPQDNHPLSLRSANGLHITCTDGTLWITMTGESVDIFPDGQPGLPGERQWSGDRREHRQCPFFSSTWQTCPRRTSISQRFQLLLSNVVAQPA